VTIVDGVSNNISGMLFRAQEAGNTEYAPALAETTMATMDNQELANRYSRAIKEAGQTAVGADIIITMPTDERWLVSCSNYQWVPARTPVSVTDAWHAFFLRYNRIDSP
jgi:predicted DCC family thiol-disulfide oxidoreductase YuxK